MELMSKSNGNKRLRTIVIDDEEHQRKSLERLIQLYCPGLTVVGLADGVETGLEAIEKHNPDLVLLDIRMADGLGFDLLDRLHPFDCKVIFISAHRKYAQRALGYKSLGYLLKPVDPDELAEAVVKAGDELNI